MHNVPLMARDNAGPLHRLSSEKCSCLCCHLNMTAAPPLLTGGFAILISIDDFFVFPSAWRSVTFGWFRHTKTKGARLQMRYRLFLRMRRERRTDHRCFTVPLLRLFFFFSLSFCERNTDHRRWPSQGLKKERINPNTLTSPLADGD